MVVVPMVVVQTVAVLMVVALLAPIVAKARQQSRHKGVTKVAVNRSPTHRAMKIQLLPQMVPMML
jgi:hypothetical protein